MRDFWRAALTGLLIALVVSVVIACSRRFSLVGADGVVAYRIDHWTGRVALVVPDRGKGGPFGVVIYDRIRVQRGGQDSELPPTPPPAARQDAESKGQEVRVPGLLGTVRYPVGTPESVMLEEIGRISDCAVGESTRRQ